MKSVVIIPARYESSRFPGKPLALINKKPMLLWVAELSAKAVSKNNVYIATDDDRIGNMIENNGFNVIYTSPECPTGTDRVAEAAKSINAEIYINVQGDEPLINPKDIIKVIKAKERNFYNIVNAYCKLEDIENPENLNIPKVVFNHKRELIYISRSVIPASKNPNKLSENINRQVCIYGFNLDELNSFYDYGKKSIIEITEDIEILRFFELGKKILMIEAERSLAVDIPEDIKKIEKYLISKKNEDSKKY